MVWGSDVEAIYVNGWLLEGTPVISCGEDEEV